MQCFITEYKGYPEVMVKHCGSLKFQDGELDNILEEIQRLREIEELSFANMYQI
ncbi:MAG: hypothetical protein HZA08_13940 [Nitrospirae bacterium]|nr:hypothetical protein [Nitrospirota bacterium]